jgi:hypothetical protein
MSLSSTNALHLGSVLFFPHLSPIGLEHKEIITYFSGLYEKPNSDLNFVSLWGYMYSECGISQLNNNLVIKLLDYHDQKPYFSFIGNNKVAETSSVLLEFAKNNGFEPYLRTIHEDILDGVIPKLQTKFDIRHDPDFDDYIFDLTLIPQLDGGRYSDRRREIHSFKKKYPEYLFKKIDLASVSIQREITDLFSLWEVQNSPKVSIMESNAFQRVLTHAEELNVEGFGLYVGNIIVGFMLCEPLNDQYVMSHYAKSNYFYNFSYSMLVYLTACYYGSKKYKFLNFQQDLGISGLRIYKRLWRPLSYTHKYIISFKNTSL